jgi:hypothetical protein
LVSKINKNLKKNNQILLANCSMRLTPELINISPQFVNPLQERELDLRGNKIALIENLGVTKV